jgi:hypothetical protein
MALGEIPTKKRGRNAYIFTDPQEVGLAEWYTDHPVLYNKRLKSYKDIQKKKP